MLLAVKDDVAVSGLPLVLNGCETASRYNVYAVASEKKMSESKLISWSASCEVQVI